MIQRLRLLSLQQAADLIWAALELWCAEQRLRKSVPRATIGQMHHKPVNPDEVSLVKRVAWAIPRAAALVPWRSDCLRQALAGQRWLGRKGISTELRLGARKRPDGTLDAHAWLMVSGEVVTGENAEAYQVFS